MSTMDEPTQGDAQRPGSLSRPWRVAAIGCGTSTVIGGVLLVLMLLAVSSMSQSCTLAFTSPCTRTDSDLNRAARDGSTAEVERLVREGGDPNGRDASGETPLSCTATGHHLETAVKLVDLGADAKALAAPRRTELVRAAIEHDDAPGYGALVDHDLASNPATVDELVRAIDGNADRMIAALLGRGAPGAPGLRHAVETNKAAPVRVILDAPTPIPAPEGEESLLARAAFIDNPPIVDALLAHGADPNDGGVVNQGEAILALYTISNESPKGPTGTIAGVLAGNAQLPGEIPPLVIAAVRGNTTNVVRLLDAGADPNRTGLGVYSPLYAAVISGNLDTVTTLLARGAVPGPVVAPGSYTPRQVAQLNGRSEIEHVLAEAEARAGLDTSLPPEDVPLPTTTRTSSAAIATSSPPTPAR